MSHTATTPTMTVPARACWHERVSVSFVAPALARTSLVVTTLALVLATPCPLVAQQDQIPKPAAQARGASQPVSAGEPDTAKEPSARVLDRVLAVVNNQVILASDLNLEQRLYRLLPIHETRDASPTQALRRLTTRALIEQQILLEDPQGLEVAPRELEDSLTELRRSLPACKVRDCTTAEGWIAYLATLELTPAEVSTYWANRMALLRFIEQRFRSGAQISQEEIQTYYRETLVPQYPKPEEAPPLDRISPRIHEILLQQRVNALLNDWLKSLQDQGQVEVLDASLRMPETESAPKPQPAKPAGPSTPVAPPPAAPAPDPSKPAPPPATTQPSASPSAVPTPKQQPEKGNQE